MRLLTEVSITGKALSRHILIVATIASNVLCGVVRTEATSPEVMQQIQGLLEEKAARTPAQQKIGSHLIYAWKLSRGEPIANGVQTMPLRVRSDAAGRALVDISAPVSPAVLATIVEVGGEVVNSFAPYRAIRAWLPLNQVEEVAALPDVVAIRPAIEPIHRKLTTSEGDVAHRANLARSTFGINGSGVSVGVLSDSVDNLAQVQKTGDVGAVTVLPGQSGVPDTGEGTALLEIVYDLAPGAAAFFATTGDSEASMATNIQALRSAGCDILVDDVAFFSEPVFQDGIIAQAIESVAADGAIYVSAAQRPAYLDERAGVDGNARSARYRVAGAGGGTRDRCAQHGGLVARSAHHYGTVAGHRWRRHLRKLVFLGTPHHGAALERGGHRLHRLFDRTPYTAPFARLGKIRSAGITDLRHGSLLDEDWHGRDRFAHGEDARRPVPLPTGVDCFAIGATMGSTPRDLRGRLLGDGIVPLPSALGRHRDPQFTLALPKSHQWIARDMSHFDLLSRPQVYERIHAWLAG